MAWNYPHSKTIKTPDALGGTKKQPGRVPPVKNDTNAVTGTRAARPQKPVTWT